ncbi:MAG TPA: glucoamylase family protein [Pyrinomonadaceae bacterium]|nr:glucoamylase family protein [Pyrinomonadaceae bacterium]
MKRPRLFFDSQISGSFHSRALLSNARRAVVLLLLACALLHALALSSPAIAPPPSAQYSLSTADEIFLEDMERREFRYFWEQADPRTGLVPDRARTDKSPLDENHRDVASIAATGFGLTALCIASERQWIQPDQAKERVRATLRFFADQAEQFHGWFYHWLDAKSGARRWNSEVSSIDTALLLAGVLTVRQKFANDKEIVRLATEIYERADFKWMLNGHPTLLSMGWKPETGFLKSRWDTFNEDPILYMLAIGSPTHPISARSWYAFKRQRMNYAGYSYVTTEGVPLFMHQYPGAWIDYRQRREQRGWRTDYFLNSISATRAHRAFCISLAREFPGYGPDMWGITASDGVRGYMVWGGPPRDPAIDGTIVPSAAGGSLMFTPDISLQTLRAMKARFGEKIYGRYGFTDAFNPNNGWIDTDVIGINVGIMLLSGENLRSGVIWHWFMRNAEIPKAMDLIGLKLYGREQTHFRGRRKIRKPQLSSVREGKAATRRRAVPSAAGLSGGSGGSTSGVMSTNEGPLPASTKPANGRFEKLIATKISSSFERRW